MCLARRYPPVARCLTSCPYAKRPNCFSPYIPLSIPTITLPLCSIFLQVIVVYYVVRNNVDGDVHVFKVGQGGYEVENFDIQVHKF